MKTLQSTFLLCLFLLPVSFSVAQKNKIEKLSLYDSGDSVMFSTNRILLGIEAENTKGKRKFINKSESRGNTSWLRYNVKVLGLATFNRGVLEVDRSKMTKETANITVIISPKKNPSLVDSLSFYIPQMTNFFTQKPKQSYSYNQKIDVSKDLFVVFENKDTLAYGELDELTKTFLLFNNQPLKNNEFEMPSVSPYGNSFVEVQVVMAKDTNLFAKLPIDYDFNQTYYYESKGSKGQNGRDGRGSVCGSGGSKDGRDGVSGYDGRKGGTGGNVDVYISEHYTKDSLQLIKVILKDGGVKNTYFFSPQNGYLTINVSGGEGGDGGDGSDGGNGANSEKYSDVGCGGNGGDGGNGGVGGNGGQVKIYVSKSDEKYVNNIYTYIGGGLGGSGGRGGNKGQSGTGTTSTKGQGISDALGLKNGIKGSRGEAGEAGISGGKEIILLD